MRIGEVKVVEWVQLGEPLGPHQTLAQRRDHVMHHNKYKVLTEHVQEAAVSTLFHLTPDLMAAAYEYLRVSRPFSAWRLPEADEVEFHVTKHKEILGDHTMLGAKHVIRCSATNIGTTDMLMRVMAHEMIHAHCDRRGVRGEHGRDFQAAADKVCRFHGFDRKAF